MLTHDVFAQRVIEVAAVRRDLPAPSMFDGIVHNHRTEWFFTQSVLTDQLSSDLI